MKEIKILLAFGSNLGNRQGNIEKAYKYLQKANIKIEKKSDFYKSKPYGIEDQPYFLNSAAVCKTNLSPQNLLATMKKIEKNIGRKETFRWGPRVIDIDIIFYDEIKYISDNLTIPHKDFKNRDFVIIPAKSILNNEWNV